MPRPKTKVYVDQLGLIMWPKFYFLKNFFNDISSSIGKIIVNNHLKSMKDVTKT